MQTLVSSNLTPVGETTMNEENSLQNNSDKSERDGLPPSPHNSKISIVTLVLT